jgi:hypothetical protein
MTVPPAGAPSGPSAAGLAGAPAWVRNGSSEVQREYQLGLEFERLLVQQLTSTLSETTGQPGEATGAADSGEGTPEAASTLFKTMLPGALADGVIAGGGLGLAAELARGLQGRAGDGAAQPGTNAGSPTGAAALEPSGGVQADTTGGTRA